MSTEMIKVLDELCARFGIAVDWTAENVMPYAQQLMEKYIRYTITYNIGQIVLLLVITLVFGVLFVRGIPKAKANDWDYDFDSVMTVVCGVVFAIMFFIFLFELCENGTILIECWTFPEKVIFDYLKTL